MATPTKLDIQAVKDAMAKTPGLNYVDAARQVRGVQNPVAPITAPVAPLVPTPTVAPITNQEVQQGVNAVGGTAEQRRQTRTDITANQTIAPPVAPVSPSVTESPAPVTEKTGITQDAFQQAQAKSAEIKAQNDAVMAQNKQKSDLAREDAALAAQAAIPTDKKGIVNAMVTGASIPVQKTEAYNKAVVTSDLFKKFSGMTSDQLFQNLQQGQIGTELSGLLASNPNFAIAKQKYEQVQKTNAINTQTNAMYNAANGKANTVVDELGKIESKYSAPPGTNAQAYEQFVTQDPDVVKSGLELKNLATQINTVTKTYNDALKSLKEQYPDMPASALITLMGTRTKDTKELLDSYISAKELAKGDFDLAMKMADGHYNAVSKDIAVQQQEAQQIAQEQRQMQNTLALGQAQFDQKIAQQTQAMNDPTMAISTMIEEYKKLGIPFTRSTQQVISDFQSSGQDLPTYLSELQKLIQSKPEYQRVQDQEAGKGISYQTIGDSVYRQNSDGSLTKTNISANKTKDPVWQEWTDSNGVKQAGWITPGVNPTVSTGTKPTGNIVPVTAGNKTVRLDQSGASGFESAINQLTTAGIPIVVGQGARDQTATIKEMADRYGIPFNASNPAETAQKLRTAGHQVADPGKSNHESGMAIDVYGDSKLGKVTPAQEKILNANGWYSAGIPGDAGHFEYRGGGTGTGGEDIKMQALSLTQGLGGTADERQAFADNVIKVAQRDKISLADAKKKLGYKSSDDENFAKTRKEDIQSLKKDTREKLSNANTALTLLNQPQTAIGDVASIVGFLKTIDPASVARESEVASVENARGMIDGLSNIFAKAKEGTKLTDTQRTQLKGAIQTIVDAGNAKYYESIYNTSKEFKDRGLDPTVYISKNDVDKAQKQFGQSDKIKEEVTSILPGATGFKSFMSELSNLINQ